MSDDLAGVLFRHRERLKETGNVLSRYGFPGSPITPPRLASPALPGGFSPAWQTPSWRL
jgi:hypothetical protein